MNEVNEQYKITLSEYVSQLAKRQAEKKERENNHEEQFKLFCFDKLINIKIGDKGTIEIKADEKNYAVISKDILLEMLSHMEHNQCFLKVPKYYLMECINEVYNPSMNKRQYYGRV